VHLTGGRLHAGEEHGGLGEDDLVYQRWWHGNGLVGQLVRGDGPGSVPSWAGRGENDPR
jgi:hypothetical protein